MPQYINLQGCPKTMLKQEIEKLFPVIETYENEDEAWAAFPNFGKLPMVVDSRGTPPPKWLKKFQKTPVEVFEKREQKAREKIQHINSKLVKWKNKLRQELEKNIL